MIFEYQINFVSIATRDYSRSSVVLDGIYKKFRTDYFEVPSGFFKASIYVLKNREVFNAANSITIVMSPSTKLTAVFKLLSKRPVILDAGWPQIDGILSRGLSVKRLIRFCYIYFVDFLGFQMADLVLLESNVQLKRVQKVFRVDGSKLERNFTGFNERILDQKSTQAEFVEILDREILSKGRKKKMIVLFRGKVNRESGIQNIVSAAKIMQDDVIFIFATSGGLDRLHLPSNCILREHISWGEMKALYERSDICIGQISDLHRLRYTIPHKAFEAGFFGKPYITTSTPSISELYEEEAIFKVDSPNPASLVNALNYLQDATVRDSLSFNISKNYLERASQKMLSERIETLALNLLA